MNVLSIQSWVAYGHVGNASALFPLQRLGANVWAVNTVQFSNHTGYGAWTGQVFTGEQISEVLAGIEARGVLARCDAVLSGYIGDPGIGEAIARAVQTVRRANPNAVYCCDPVIGDVGRGAYVREGIAEFLRDRLVSLADITTPNQFELEQLTGIECPDIETVKRAVGALQARMYPEGPRCVLVTSLHTDDTPEDSIDMLASEGGEHYLVRTPKLNVAVNGAGDAMAALFLFHRLRSGSAAGALEGAASSIHGLLRVTEEAGSRELLLVEAQDEFLHPSELFMAVPA
jgi:pyridoxine kinase